MKRASTTALLKSLGLSTKELFEYFLKCGFIGKNNESWALTSEGKEKGGEYKESKQYWGYENKPEYLARKKEKIKLYKKYGFNLIELQDKEVQNLDDILPKMLLKYGIKAY